ncbi:MAG: bifunctional folylpolyglutamate synthase/dihydrofolate synthase [Mycobacteriales bacterium]
MARDAEARAELAAVEAELRARWPENQLEPSLDRIRALVDLLGQPQRAYPVIHLTGTNGKTSTARMIDSLLRTFQLRTGRYTSPDLGSPTERISIDGQPVSAERFVEVYREVAPYAAIVDRNQPVPLSYFEYLTAMGFAAFADAPVEAAVVEVGLGGAWDATNVADGRVAVVTPIALDHENYLGDTVESIATEKAGIIKAGATLIASAQPTAAAQILLRRAVEVGATVAREGLEFGVIDRKVAVGGQLLRLQGLGGEYPELFLPLHGEYQARNAAAALAAVEAFFGAGANTGPLDVEVVKEGFAQASSPGRLEVVRRAPTILVDSAHNPAGMEATVAAVEDAFGFTRLVGVLAVLEDKDVAGMLEILEPVLESVVVTANSSPRALDAEMLGARAVEYFGAERVEVALRLDDAIEAAVRQVEEGADLEAGGLGVLITGSVVTAGDARALLVRS